MNSLSVATAIEKNKLASNTPFLVCLDVTIIDPNTLQVVDTMYLVRNNEDLTYNGNTYVATPFEIQLGKQSGGIPQVNLSISDYSRAVQSRLEAYGGGISSKVTVTVVNADNLDQPPEVVEFFQVVGASAASYKISFQLGAENPLLLNFPRGRQLRDRCRWTYMGAECRYAGNLPTCDLSLKGANGCQAHGNTINFGGLPGVSASGARYG